VKKVFCLCIISVFLFAGCSDQPNFENLQYEGIQYNGIDYHRIYDEKATIDIDKADPILVQVYLIGKKGYVDMSTEYTAYLCKPGEESFTFLFFDSCYWAREGFFDEWTIPHE
jgi:hypothetical protein